MGTRKCMNETCGATTSSDWKKGWGLKSGGFATLCSCCGSAYENFVFCETFHSDESGWRGCRVCRKPVHCGCIASKHLHEYMDFGGVSCKNCSKRFEIHPVQSAQIPADVHHGKNFANGVRNVHSIAAENRIDDEKLITDDVTSALEQLKREDFALKTGESSKRVPNLSQQYSSSAFAKADNNRPKHGAKDMHEALAQPFLNFSPATLLSTPAAKLPLPVGDTDGIESSKGSFQQRARNNFSRPQKPSHTTSSETSKGNSQTRVARPPAEGRGRNQLLPRYWPRITDQELKQLSGDLKSNIVPLFEKILSASDAGRIGRLVLPKACAEAYFPTINQSEGIPIKIQDIKGKEWTFQFRFWPNNNSRMYVLEGVTPCIQNMQLQAGDTVIFSRIEPRGQLMIGCRKATNVDAKDTPATNVAPNGDTPGETLNTGVNVGSRGPDDSSHQLTNVSEKKKARNVKNQRHLMHGDDAMELRVTCEEAQELFRPSPSSEPTVVMVEDYEFEEFDEPPVFGKRTVFISRSAGEQEQLAQCDNCFKWRRLPVHALLSSKWTCSDNTWDPKRRSCSAPEEINPRDLDFCGVIDDSKNQKHSDKQLEVEQSGLDALATLAVLGDNIGDLAESSAGATTRHPRHRPGCSCIVCIQPPSGTGKHEPSCKCNVCSTVRRRFKTLMLRKRKRQSERETQEKHTSSSAAAKIDPDREDAAGFALLNMSCQENETIQNGGRVDVEDRNKGRLDLNSDPDPGREDNAVVGTDHLVDAGPSSLPQTDGMGLTNNLVDGGSANVGPISFLPTKSSSENIDGG